MQVLENCSSPPSSYRTILIRQQHASERNRVPSSTLAPEIRDRTWGHVLGGGLLHLSYVNYQDTFEDYSDDDESDEVLKAERTRTSAWETTYCVSVSSQDKVYAAFWSGKNDPERTFALDGDVDRITDRDCHWHCQDYLENGYGAFTKDGCFDTETSETTPEMQPIRLQLLRVYRQLYIEANPVLWLTNTFSFHEAKAFHRFMVKRSALQMKLLKHLSLAVGDEGIDDPIAAMMYGRAYSDEWAPCFTSKNLKSMCALQSLHLEFDATITDADWGFGIERIAAILSNLRVLPLENVKVIVGSIVEGHAKQTWPAAERLSWASDLEDTLLNPNGAQAQQDQWNEINATRQRRKEIMLHSRSTNRCCPLSQAACDARKEEQRAKD